MTALSQTANDYLRLCRTLGHKLADAGRLLPRLVTYRESNGLETITIEAAMAWAQQPDADPTSTVWVSRMAVARGFARHLAGRDSRTEVPPVGILPSRRHRRVPYIYSSTEIVSLMAQAHLTMRSEFRAATIETLFGLLAATGMRVGEAIRLDDADLDWTEGLAVVRSSKFGADRQVRDRYHCDGMLAANGGGPRISRLPCSFAAACTRTKSTGPSMTSCCDGSLAWRKKA